MDYRDVVWLCAIVGLTGLTATTGCERPEQADPEATAEAPASTEQPEQTTEEPGSATRTAEQAVEATPPTIVNLRFEPSKMVRCGDQIKICVDAHDAQDDPLSFRWEYKSGMKPLSGPTIEEEFRNNGMITNCATVKPAEGAAQMEVIVEEKTGEKEAGADSLTFPIRAVGDNC